MKNVLKTFLKTIFSDNSERSLFNYIPFASLVLFCAALLISLGIIKDSQKFLTFFLGTIENQYLFTSLWALFIILIGFCIHNSTNENSYLKTGLYGLLIISAAKGILSYLNFWGNSNSAVLPLSAALDKPFLHLLIIVFAVNFVLTLRNRQTLIEESSANITKWYILASTILLILYLLTILKNGWVMEDAFITMRSVDNFVNGHGPVWNIGERVQAFTHPLWFFILSFFYFFTREAYFTNLLISVLISISAYYFVLFKLPINKVMGLVAASALIISRSFVDYSTSGLESCVTHLLLILFFYFYFKKDKQNIILYFIASLAALNRMDTILFYIPALLMTFIISADKIKETAALLKGFSLFILWEIFSIVYYGFPFPNTYYAKLNTGYPIQYFLEHATFYIKNFITTDITSFLIIVTSIIFTFFRSTRKLLVLSIGMLFYTIYIYKIGGCYMSGRFFSPLITSGAIILTQLPFNSKKITWVLLIIVIFYGGTNHRKSPLFNTKKYIDTSFYDGMIADERGWMYNLSSLLHQRVLSSIQGHDPHLKNVLKNGNIKYFVRHNIGFFGYSIENNVYILDDFGLADPLISKLKAVPGSRIGHFGRIIPDGYRESIISGENRIVDPYLSEYYDKLNLITRGPLFSPQRFIEILKINFGAYDPLLENYMKAKPVSPEQVHSYSELNRESRKGTPWHAKGNFVLPSYGITIKMDHVMHSKKFLISMVNDECILYFYRSGSEIAKMHLLTLPLLQIDKTLVDFEHKVPDEASTKGFDSIKIVPKANSDFLMHSIGHIRFY